MQKNSRYFVVRPTQSLEEALDIAATVKFKVTIVHRDGVHYLIGSYLRSFQMDELLLDEKVAARSLVFSIADTEP